MIDLIKSRATKLERRSTTAILLIVLFTFSLIEIEAKTVDSVKIARIEGDYRSGAICILTGDSLWEATKFKDADNEYVAATAYFLRALDSDSCHALVLRALGNAFLKLRQFDRAEYELRKAIRCDSSSAFAYNLLGSAIYLNPVDRGGLWQAIQAWHTALNLTSDPESATRLRLDIGNALLNEGFIEQAVPELEEALQLDSNCLEARVALSNAYALLGDSANAYAEVDRVLRADSTFISAYNTRAIMSIVDNQFMNALKCYYFAVRYDSLSCRNYQRFAGLANWYIDNIRLLRNRFFLAARIAGSRDLFGFWGYQSASELESDIAFKFEREKAEYQKLYKSCADSMLIADFISKSLKKYNQYIFVREDSTSYFEYAEFLDALMQAVENLCLIVRQKAEIYAPNCRWPVYNSSQQIPIAAENKALRIKLFKAQGYFDKGDLKKAKREYGAILFADSGYPQAYLGLGIVYQRSGQLDSANAMFKRAVELEPQKVEPRVNWAFLMSMQGKFSESREQCQAALRLSPDSSTTARLHTIVAVTWIKQKSDGSREQAAIELDSALTFDSSFAEVFYWRGKLAEGKNDSVAAENYRRAIALDNRLAQAYNALGALLCDQNSQSEQPSARIYSEAVGLLEKALNLDKANSVYKSNLSKAKMLQAKK